MKNLTLYSIIVMILLGVSSCSDVELPEEPMQDGITLTVRTAPIQTKATQAGEDALNENKIKSVHYFLYAVDPENPQADPSSSTPFMSGEKTGLDISDEYKFQLNISSAEFNTVLFPRPYNYCYVYFIVNLPEGNTIDGDETISDLKQIALAANFESTDVQDCFVMDGFGKVNVTDRSNTTAAEAEVEVKRVASKITLNIDMPESLTVSGEKWYPDVNNLTVTLHNGVKTATLVGNPVEGTEDNHFNKTYTGPKKDTYVFYSYPTDWSVGDKDEAYITLDMKWSTVQGEFESSSNRYKILLSNTDFLRNTWYNYIVNINQISNYTDPNPIELTPSCTIASWQTGLSVGSEIEGARYLVVEQNTYYLHNENTVFIPVNSSHHTDVVSARGSYKSLVGGEDTELTRGEDFTITWDGTRSGYVFSHTLNNNINSENPHFVPINFSIKIVQSDNVNIGADISITQYPAVYVEAEVNRDWEDTGNINDNLGYVWVNGYRGNDPNGNLYSQSYFSNAGNDKNDLNPKMYIISISSLAGTNYILGDPRSKSYWEEKDMTYWLLNTQTEWYTDIQSINWYLGNAFYTEIGDTDTDLEPDGISNRVLRYYYPTDANINDGPSSSTYNMIAPKYRIASEFGAILPRSSRDIFLRGNYEAIKARCASYQEDGFPAGRWRLPTWAELSFANTLSDKGLIEPVFDKMNYWCAHGYRGYYEESESYLENADLVYGLNNYNPYYISVRCVYDEWYWEQVDRDNPLFGENNRLEDPLQFFWGDMPRQNVSVTANY